MATPRKQDDRMVSRTYRTALRSGDDYTTVEETIVLPIDASDEEIAQAVDTGWRIYRAQKEAIESQLATLREERPQPTIAIRDPESPASEKQRNYVAALQDDLSWSDEQLTRYAGEQGVDLVTMTKGQASTFIDGLKRIAEDRGSYQPQQPQQPNQQQPMRNGQRRREAAL